jgi:hypothetical protein
MLNPFLQSVSPEKRKKLAEESEESFAQMHGYSMDSASPRPTVGLWVGKLLIRMGQKLTKEDVPLNSNRQNA